MYVLKNWIEGNVFYYTQFHILQGREKNQKQFVYKLKQEKSVLKAEFKSNCLLTLRKEPLEESIDPVFNPKIIMVKPVIQRTDGFEDWELASWDKKALMNIFKIPQYKVKLHSIQRTELNNIVLPHLYPRLSPKQKEAIELAVKEGYYNFPRKIDLIHLAKIAHISRPAYQESLRNAEKKLIPFLTEGTLKLSENAKKGIKQAEEDFKQGKFYTHEEVKRKLEL